MVAEGKEMIAPADTNLALICATFVFRRLKLLK